MKYEQEKLKFAKDLNEFASTLDNAQLRLVENGLFVDL